MNKHEAKIKVKDLEHSLEFLKIEIEREINSLKTDLKMYKDWFKSSQEDNQKLRNENNRLYQENENFKSIKRSVKSDK